MTGEINTAPYDTLFGKGLRGYSRYNHLLPPPEMLSLLKEAPSAERTARWQALHDELTQLAHHIPRAGSIHRIFFRGANLGTVRGIEDLDFSFCDLRDVKWPKPDGKTPPDGVDISHSVFLSYKPKQSKLPPENLEHSVKFQVFAEADEATQQLVRRSRRVPDATDALKWEAHVPALHILPVGPHIRYDTYEAILEDADLKRDAIKRRDEIQAKRQKLKDPSSRQL